MARLRTLLWNATVFLASAVLYRLGAVALSVYTSGDDFPRERITALEEERDALRADALRFGCGQCSARGHRLRANYCTECGRPMVRVAEEANDE